MSESENIHLDLPNNLCVEQDAFEQFQATSAYEEEEFITLSDIVEPPKPTLDLNACLDEIQDDVCIVSETDLPRNENIMSECIVDINTQLLNPVTAPTNSDMESSSVTGKPIQAIQDVLKITPQHTPKKRGRKRKNTAASVEDRYITSEGSSHFTDYSSSSEKGNIHNVFVETPVETVIDRLNQSDSKGSKTSIKTSSRKRKRQLHTDTQLNSPTKFVLTETIKPRKRGRPKKVNTPVIEQLQSDNSLENNIQTENSTSNVCVPYSPAQNVVNDDEVNISSNSNKETSNLNQCDVTSVLNAKQVLNKKTTRRRGRPKKITIENEITKQSKNIEISNTISKEISKQNSSVSSSSSKLEKTKSKNEVEDKKYDDIELELIRMLSTPTKEIEEQCKKQETENKVKLAKKRGRKTKKPAEERPVEKPHEHTPEQNAAGQSIEKDVQHDDADDIICLSSLKKRFKPEDDHNKEENTLLVTENVLTNDNINQTPENIPEISAKRNSKKPIMSDFEYNVDTIGNEFMIENETEKNVSDCDNPEIESNSKRPVRRKAKKVLHYDEGSDEDPFANVELSDDDGDLSVRKSGRYYSDDEYIPGKKKKGKTYSESESSVSGSDELEDADTVAKKLGRKKGIRSDDLLKKSYKKSKKDDLKINATSDVTSTAADTTTQNDDDLDQSLQSPDITTNENITPQRSHPWGSEFENFIAQKIQGTNIKIKKLTGTTSTDSAIPPLEIPVLDPNEAKKPVDVSTQTNKTSTKTVEVQTTSPHESVMKTKVPLTIEQSEKACEFLKGIVKNTSELGQLMIQKSEDFINKKINTKNVTDTHKMDYCVQKSFLLFKLAKHNLIQMEVDLANEYEQFLKTHNMLQYQESPKCIVANSKQNDSDSDCEIVEEPIPDPEKEKQKEKSKFNLKTVFLNKELSIKIAKKSSEEPQARTEKVTMKGGRHTVWINDSIMVKKVKPTQSFLAQDSRNKKPPDHYITIEMVKNFFDNYYKRQKVLLTCAPFVSPEWRNVTQMVFCNYFIAQSDSLSAHSGILHTPQSVNNENIDVVNNNIKYRKLQPKSLVALCTKALHKYMYETRDNNKESDTESHHLSPLAIQVEQEYQPDTLFKLSFNVISSLFITLDKVLQKNLGKSHNINSLKKLCLRRVNTLIHQPITTGSISRKNSSPYFVNNVNKSEIHTILNGSQETKSILIEQKMKSLFTLCVETIINNQKFAEHDMDKNNIYFNKLKTLKCIALEKVKHLLYNNFIDLANGVYATDDVSGQISSSFVQDSEENASSFNKSEKLLALTIESVNTLSDDIFANLPDTTENEPSCSEDDSNFSNCDEYDPGYAEPNEYENSTEDNNWVSRVQLQELRSCVTSVEDTLKTSVAKDSNSEGVLASIKIEPTDETAEDVYPSIIKTEVAENDDITFNPLATKYETPDSEIVGIIPEQSSSSYDVDAFEEFAKSNKLFHSEMDYDFANDEIFSQSALRIRRQHEPDMDDELDTSMSLLVPQQNAESAKDRLMKSSSEDETNTQKNALKKKRKTRPKISRLKNKDVTTVKNKNTPENEVAVLTRKMQEKIRQEEKSDESSDSELETLAKLRQDKSKKESGDKVIVKQSKDVDDQIQCSEVDSTEHLNDQSVVSADSKDVNQKKPLKILLRKKAKGAKLDSKNSTEADVFVMQPGVPVELLECEPTLPIMNDDMQNIESENSHIDAKNKALGSQEESPCIDRHGWKCYPVNNNDTKIYEHAYILLERLPESFVETYFKYQGVSNKDRDDTDIDRLTNLQSLHRTCTKDNKAQSKLNKGLPNGQLKSKDPERYSKPNSPVNDDHYDELTPSEDEGANIDDEIAPAPSQHVIENVMAKSSLMNDNDSDSEKPANPEDQNTEESLKKIKKEKEEEPIKKNHKPGPKSKTVLKDNNSTLLTADKMMNKELELLHAPVKLDADDSQVKDALKKPSQKNVNRPSTRLRTHLERVKAEEESSSEEEKQWVTTKEKLLKRLVKKQGDPSVDDAKRAKIVSEFIEKRGDAPDKRSIIRTRKPRSRKKYLERKKQMIILNRELFGEDTSYAGRNRSQAFGKGRRNIRKVIDKKSLARSTVIANMEEFERKRRLNMQQTRLREQLGCEEGVNVLVINDEVCLEYDFEKMRPVVTIHPFFTKVMKAHQYEGVKFMWDACFESLAMMASGHPGGGCILAHCMGLGKTLQVLALLHTVLTHPGVGIKRVLVCCPLSTVLNWVDEINKWIGPVTNLIKVFELSKLKKNYERAYQLEDWYKDGGIFIIGYELFRSLTTLDPILDDIRPKIVDKIRHALLSPGPDVVICDEGHLLKNDASVLAVAMSRVATRRRIVLTGTPMQNNLREYYCMVNFIKPNLLGTYSEYSNRFENPIMNGQHRDSQEEDIKLMKARTHILHKVLEGCLQRQEASVLYPYLPKKYEYTVFIPPTKCQWDLYKHYMMTYAVEQNNKQKQSILKDFHVLQKIWTHPQVLHNFLMKARDERNKIKEDKLLEDDLAQEDLAASEDVKPNQTEVWWLQYLAGGDMLESLDSSNKFVVVFQLLEECIALGDKVLIFSTSLYTMDALEYFLKRINKWSLGQEYFRLDGSVPAEVRQKWCREFNAPHNVNTKLFLISTRAGCLGLNMTAANRVIILDTSWNPAHDIQSIFRVYRFGQKKDCYIYRLVAMGTMEQKIYERSVTKQAVSCRVVDEQQIDRHYNMAELTELYRYDEEGSGVEAGLAAGVCDVALLRVAARARLHAVREHDSLLRGSREQHLPEHERHAAWMQFQQEHANNEMQDRLMKASQGIQRILEADYVDPSGSVLAKMETGDHPQITPQPGPKVRKSKRKASTPSVEDSNVNESSQSSEQKDVQSDTEKEEAKVKKIMQLLIKHNFRSSQRTNEITKLVANVRSIVDAGGAGLASCDELTRSIATVMLQEEDINQSSQLGDIIASPSPSEVKLETYEPPDKLSDKNPNIKQNETLEETLGNPDEGSLLVPVMETTRKQKGRPRKNASDVFQGPVTTRSRGRPRQYAMDTEPITIGDEIKTSDQLMTDLGANTSIGKKSKRLMGKARRSFASDADSSVTDIITSREHSPDISDEPLPMNKKNENNMNIIPDSSATLKEDKDSSNRNNECFVVLDDREQPIQPEPSKPKRAIAVKSTAKSTWPERNLNGKIKRKAAKVAEKHFEKLDNEDIVTLDDDDEEWVDDSEMTYARSPNKAPAFSRGLDTQKDKSKTTSNRDKSTSHADVASSVKKQKDSSILLSDDEDGVTKNARQPTNEAAETEPEEVVPLHPSMLSNANFIKIVAYAYQSNRMLDEDAALLAARYSTQKALKEYETTGKGITSGPLYDIAVKVLTKDVLKKLHNKKGSKKNEPSPTKLNNTESVLTSSKPGSSKVETGQEVTSKQIRNPPPSYEPVSSDYSTQAKVVPIGLFRGSAMNQKPQEVVEECILPDDDDCILGTTNEISQQEARKQKSQQFIITSVKASRGIRSEISSAAAPEIIVPEINNPVVVSMSQSQNNTTNSVNRVQPFVTITEKPQLLLGSLDPMHRLSKPNLNVETTIAGSPSVTPNSKSCLTLTISEGKLVSQSGDIINLSTSNYSTSNFTPISQKIQTKPSSNDTICLDSDEEDAPTADILTKIVRFPPPLAAFGRQQPAVTPVAVTTSNVNFSMTKSIRGVTVAPLSSLPQTTPSIKPDSLIKWEQNSKNQKLSAVSESKSPDLMKAKRPNKTTSALTLKLPKIAPKPPENAKLDAFSSKPFTPEEILNSVRADNQIKKVCKPGDIVRITKEGNIEVLSKVDTLPDKIKPQGPSEKSGKDTNFQLPGRSTSPRNDPLSILKDVIHIQADEYDTPASKPQPEKPNKLSVHMESNKHTVKGQIKDSGKNITLQYTLNTHSDSSTALPEKKTNYEPANKEIVSKKKDSKLLKNKEIIDKKQSSKSVSKTIDLTNFMINTKTVMATAKSRKPNTKGSIVIGSSKDIIICTKPIGNTLTKASTSSNINLKVPVIKRETLYITDKKRTSPWPDPNAAKKKKGPIKPAQTLEDFDIDDIDDIIELE